MKVLIISDTHGKSSCIEQIYNIVGDVDMLIHLGDVEGDEELIYDRFNCEIHMVRETATTMQNSRYMMSSILETREHL